MKDLNKIQEFFSKPLEENIVKAFDLQKGLNGMGYDVKVKYLDDFGKDVYEIYLNKPVDSDKIFFDAKKLGFPNVRIFDNMNEIDLNDLVLMKMRAAKDAVRGDSPASQGKRAAIGDDISRVSAEKIKFLKKERAQLMRDMEQEAEPEGGPIANKYGSKLNRIDKAIAKLSGRKEMTYDQAIAENKLLKQAKLSSAEYQKVKKLKDFNPNDYEWNPSESLYVKEKKSKFKKHGEMSGFDMRGIDEASEASKFKKGDKITYYGNKGVVNSAKYNPFAKDWDYTISYIEDGTRKGESGVRDKELKSSPINEAKFTDYSNNELAAYAKELSKQRADAASKGQSDLVSGINKEIEAAARELKKRSQKLKDLSRTELNEANVPSNIAEFAKRKGVSSLVKTVAGWAEKVGKRIMGGTAIGKNYDTLILDMTFQGSEIRINTEYETIELYDEPVRTFAQFKRVYEENQEENLDEAITDLRIDNPKFGPAPKQFTSLRAKLGDKSLLDKIQMINVNTLRELLDELDSYNLEEGNYNPDQEQLDDEDEIFMPVDDEGRPLGEVEIGDKVKINKEYGGGKGKVTDKIGSFIVVNGKSYHESDVEESGMNEEEGYSKFLKDDPEFPGGKTKGLTPDVMNKILMKIVQDIDETKKLGKNLTEELCPKGKAYIKKRQAAGEKSSAYLSGRAVKVCKGQMEG
jgi:hypothetical protein